MKILYSWVKKYSQLPDFKTVQIFPNLETELRAMQKYICDIREENEKKGFTTMRKTLGTKRQKPENGLNHHSYIGVQYASYESQ